MRKDGPTKKQVQLKALVSLVSVILAVALVTGFLLIRRYYLSYNLLRLDPLEMKSAKGIIPDKNDTLKSIWLLGDSRIAYWDESLLPGKANNFINLGIPGQTSSQVRLRLKENLERSAPSMLLLEVGINDIKIIGIDKLMERQVLEGTYINLTSIIEICMEKNIEVIYLNIFPAGKPGFLRSVVWNKIADSTIVKLNDRMKAFCLDNNVRYFDAYEVLSSGCLHIKDSYRKDFLHINDDGYKALTSQLVLKYGNDLCKTQ